MTHTLDRALARNSFTDSPADSATVGNAGGCHVDRSAARAVPFIDESRQGSVETSEGASVAPRAHPAGSPLDRALIAIGRARASLNATIIMLIAIVAVWAGAR